MKQAGLSYSYTFLALVGINQASWSAKQIELGYSQGHCLVKTDHLSLQTTNYTLFVRLKLYILVQRLHTGH